MFNLVNPFARITPEAKKRELLDEAKMMLVQHEAAEEYSKAQAAMLRTRINRLERELTPREVTTPALTAVGGLK